MNIYVLVEGRCTEAVIYPEWLTGLLPDHVVINDFREASGNSIFCFSGEGYPNILKNGVSAAVKDIESVGAYDALVVVLDGDDRAFDEVAGDIRSAAAGAGLSPAVRLIPIVQVKCIESWLLGNRNFVARFPVNDLLVECKRFYDVNRFCPELMAMPPGYVGSVSSYHYFYLRQVFRERRENYSKRRPGVAASVEYLQELKKRFLDGGLPSMAPLFSLVEEMAGQS